MVELNLLQLGLAASCAAIVCVWLTVVNIKKTKRVKEYLNKYEKMIDTINHIPSGILYLDNKANVVDANEFSAQLLGRQQKHLSGVSFASLFASHHAPYLDNLMADALNGKPASSNQAILAQASQRFLAVNIQYHQHDEKVDSEQRFSHKFIVTIQNQDEDQRAYESTFKRKQTLESIVDNADVFEAELDVNAKLLSLPKTLVKTMASVGVSFKDETVELDAFVEMVNQPSRSEFQNVLKQLKNVTLNNHVDAEKLETIKVELEVGKQDKNTWLCTVLGGDPNTDRITLLFRDVSQVHESLRQVAAINHKLDSYIGLSPTPSYLLDEKGEIITINAAFERLFGIRKSLIIGKRLTELNVLPTKIAEAHVSAVQQTKALTSTGNAGNLANKVASIHTNRTRSIRINQSVLFKKSNPDDSIQPDDQLNFEDTIHLNVFAQSINIPGKEQNLVYGFVQDITSLTVSERKREQAQAHFDNIVNLAPISVATVDAEDRIVNVNSNFVTKLGLLRKDIENSTLFDLFEDSASSGKLSKELHRTGRVRGFKADIKGKNNALFYSEINIDLLDESKQEYLCWISDRSNEKFQQNKLDSLLEHSGIPMAVLGSFGFSKVNSAAVKFFQLDSDKQLIGEQIYSDLINGDDAEHLKDILFQVKATGQSLSLNWQHHVNNALLSSHLTLVPLYNDKEFDSIICIWLDLTELVQADKDKKQAIELQQSAMQKMHEATEKYQHSLKKLSKLETDNTRLNEQLDEASVQVKKLEIERQQVDSKIGSLNTQLNAQDHASKLLQSKLAEQQKVSQQALSEKQALEHSIRLAQGELENKESNLQHIKSELSKLEELTRAQSGDMHALEARLNNELEKKQSELLSVQQALRLKTQEAQKEREEKRQQTELMTKLEQELGQLEAISTEKDQALEKIRLERQQLNEEFETKLKTKQQQIADVESTLQKSKQETDIEKKDKKAHLQQLEKLKAELTTLHQKNEETVKEMSDIEERERKQSEQQSIEVEAKKAELSQAQTRLTKLKALAEEERIARIENEQKVTQLTQQLDDVRSRAEQQKKMFEGDGEELREHLMTIEQQKEKLKKELEETQSHNLELSEKLQGNKQELQEAASKVERTKSDEDRLAQELTKANQHAIDLEQKLTAQEAKETELRQQFERQQKELEQSRQNIESLKQQQQSLSSELLNVKGENKESKQKLQAREEALLQAQKRLEKNQDELKQQETLLSDAKRESKIQDEEAKQHGMAHLEGLEMPQNPENWFELLAFLKRQPQNVPLSQSLQTLTDQFETLINMLDTAVIEDNKAIMLKGAKELRDLSTLINAQGLSDVVEQMFSEDTQVMLDNISIAWPSIKKAIQNTQKVIFANLYS